MIRELPPCPASPPVINARSTKLYPINVITPMFGGSSAPREVDPYHPVRLSEVRGNLRFWWRATRGAACEDVDALWAREGKVWGTTKERSRVSIDLTVTELGESCTLAGYPRYALFPFLEDHQQNRREAEGRSGVSFELQLQYPSELEDEIHAAVWAWVNFGGIGARTRRGAGALFCPQEAPPDRDHAAAWLKNKAKELGLFAYKPIRALDLKHGPGKRKQYRLATRRRRLPDEKGIETCATSCTAAFVDAMAAPPPR